MKKVDKLRVAHTIETQRATPKGSHATNNATSNATVDLKALALKGLKRNQQRNQIATDRKKQRNSTPSNVEQKLRLKKCQACEQLEQIKLIGKGCKHIVEGYYQRQWTLLDKLVVCPRGYWN